MRYSEAFCRVVELHETIGAPPLNTLEGCWEYAIDDEWRIAVNGHPDAQLCSLGANVPGFCMRVVWKGGTVGILTPFGGTFFSVAEDDFIAAVQAAIQRIKESRRD